MYRGSNVICWRRCAALELKWQMLDAVLNHWLRGLHHIREDANNPFGWIGRMRDRRRGDGWPNHGSDALR